MGVPVLPQQVNFSDGLYSRFTLEKVAKKDLSGPREKVITFVRDAFPIVHSEVLKLGFENDRVIHLPKFLSKEFSCDEKISLEDRRSVKIFIRLYYDDIYKKDSHYDYYFIAEK